MAAVELANVGQETSDGKVNLNRENKLIDFTCTPNTVLSMIKSVNSN